MKTFSHYTKITARLLLLSLVTASMLASSASLSTVAAAVAGKSIVETGPQNPGSTVTVQLEFNKPNINPGVVAEVVFLVDTSGSIGSDPIHQTALNDMKSKILNFVNTTLANYPGAVKVGITKIGNGTASFDTDNTNNPGANFAMYPVGSSTRKLNSALGVDQVATITAVNIDALRTAVNNITLEPLNNPNSPDGQNAYTTDIGPAMTTASKMFTSTTNSKYMVMLADGLANKGYCPIYPDGTPRVSTIPAGMQLQVLPSNSSYDTRVQDDHGNAGDSNFPPSYPYTTNGEPGVCSGYTAAFFGPSGDLMADNIAPHINPAKPSNSMLKQIATVYGGIRSTDIQTTTLDKIIKAVQINTITVQDKLNSLVFGSTGVLDGLYDCDSGTKFVDDVPAKYILYTPSGVGATITLTGKAIEFTSHYCLRFKATVSSAPSVTNSQPINSTDPTNQITYKDTAGTTKATDTIDPGTITINTDVNLKPTLQLTDAAGVVKTNFKPNDPIYVKSNVTNVLSGKATTGAVTRFYSNQPSVLPAGSAAAPVLYLTHGAFGGGSSNDYFSYPGGTNETKFNSASGLNYWTMPSVGTYTARLYTNYLAGTGAVYETDYTDNQVTVSYTISLTSNPDLTVSKLDLTDSAGVARLVYNQGEQIYTNIIAGNISGNALATAVQTQVYQNKPSTVAINTLSDITPSGMYIQHLTFPANTNYTYGSYPGGNFNGGYNGQKSWTATTVGIPTSRAYINYNNSVAETDTTNNQIAQKYGIITPPTNLNINGLNCTSATFGWTAGSGIDHYKIKLTNKSTSVTQDILLGNVTTSTKSGLAETTGYSWKLVPQVTIDGVQQDGLAVSGSDFTTTTCPHFTLTLPSPATATPGGQPLTETATINYAVPSAWNAATDHVTLIIRDIHAGAFDCSTIPANGAKHSGSVDGGNLTAKFGNNDTTITVSAPTTSQVPVTITAAAAASLTNYTLCVGAWSDASSDTSMASALIKVELAGWLQVGGPSATSTGAGDVHSNGSIGSIVVPSNPIQQYFFMGTSRGVVTAANSLGITPIASLSAMANSDWSWKNYPAAGSTLKSKAFSGMMTDAANNGGLTDLSTGQVTAKVLTCNSRISAVYKVDSDAVLGSSSTITYPSACDNVSLVFFINGNLQVSKNVVDQTNSGTMTFVVSGNITVDSAVTQMDGVYMFGGRFDDGAGASQLVVHGSLLGLGGSSPSATSGTFTLSSGNTGLQRNLGAATNATTPAEQILFQPKYLDQLKGSALSGSTFSWTE